MILVDWTRMGRTYCLAGAVAHQDGYQIVRPLQTRFRTAPERNVGWSAYLLDGHTRWEVFELVGAETADTEPPHAEDLWVRSLRPRRRLAPAQQRRAILEATMAHAAQPLFGAPFLSTRTAAYLAQGTGRRSLATVVVPAGQIAFSASQRLGAAEADYRVRLAIPELGVRVLPVKDHHLLARVQAASSSLEGQLQLLGSLVQQMGEQVAVRLGLSRAFPGTAQGPPACWLMADGFFSLLDPQP